MYDLLTRLDATFAPKRVDNLGDGVAEWIGWRGEWECVGDTDGAFPGQMAFRPARIGFRSRKWLDAGATFPASWAPEMDLRIHKVLRE